MDWVIRNYKFFDQVFVSHIRISIVLTTVDTHTRTVTARAKLMITDDGDRAMLHYAYARQLFVPSPLGSTHKYNVATLHSPCVHKLSL